MVDFVCDDKKIEKVLRKLCNQVVQYGGTVHDDITIKSHEGDFFISAPDSIAEGEMILVLPKEILLPVKKYNIVTVGNNMVLRSYDDDLNAEQVTLMETMLELYNLAGKVDQLQSTSTIDAFLCHSDFFEKIIAGRQREEVSFLKTIKDLPDNKYWITLYMKSRVFQFNPGGANYFSGSDADSKLVHVPVLMPIIDFLNHHPRASAYNTKFDWLNDSAQNNGNDGISVLKSCPVEGSHECYAYYAAHDAMDTFIHYDYVETYALYLRSVPLYMEISGLGTLSVKSKPWCPNTIRLPEYMEDLRSYIPEVKYNSKEKLLEISSLYIPQPNAPRALRRVLDFVLQKIEMPLNQILREELMLEIEKYIIQGNMRFYTELSAYLSSYKMPARNKLVLQNASDMVDTQLEKIRRYPFYETAIQGAFKV